MFILGLGLTACSSEPRDADDQHQIVAWINDTPIHQGVVEQIAKARGIDQDRALQHAADTLRLYFAYQEHNHNDPQLTDRETFLTTQAAVRLWIKEIFEPQTDDNKIPEKEVAAALTKVATQNHPFGPKLHGLCQVIVVPADPQPATDARQIPGFEASARAVIADMDKNLRRALPELRNSERCERFDALTELISATRPNNIKLKREAMRIDLSSERWDKDFVAQVSPFDEPTLIPAFMTKFGLHLVYLAKIFPAHLPADAKGELSARTTAQRDRAMRALMSERWRSNQMQSLLQELRKSELIEWTKRSQ